MSNENRGTVNRVLTSFGFREDSQLTDALTSELDAAEQRGRQKALEEAAHLMACHGDDVCRDFHSRASDCRKCDDAARAIRSLGSTGGGR